MGSQDWNMRQMSCPKRAQTQAILKLGLFVVFLGSKNRRLFQKQSKPNPCRPGCEPLRALVCCCGGRGGHFTGFIALFELLSKNHQVGGVSVCGSGGGTANDQATRSP